MWARDEEIVKLLTHGQNDCLYKEWAKNPSKPCEFYHIYCLCRSFKKIKHFSVSALSFQWVYLQRLTKENHDKLAIWLVNALLKKCKLISDWLLSFTRIQLRQLKWATRNEDIVARTPSFVRSNYIITWNVLKRKENKDKLPLKLN